MECKEVGSKISILATAPVVGGLLGCMLASVILPYGRRKFIILANVISIAMALLALILNYWLLVVTRVGYGIAVGLIISSAPVMLEETVPHQWMDKGFGASTNLCINFGIMTTTILGVGNPPLDDYDALKSSSYWRFIYAFPIIPCAISILMFLFIHRDESLMYSLSKDDDEQSKSLVAKIYRDEDEKTRE